MVTPGDMAASAHARQTPCRYCGNRECECEPRAGLSGENWQSALFEYPDEINTAAKAIIDISRSEYKPARIFGYVTERLWAIASRASDSEKLEQAGDMIKARDAQLFEAEREIKSLREQLDITLTALRSINTLASRHAPK